MAMNIWFDDVCVNKAYDCYLKTYTIDPAEVRLLTDTIAGADGVVDATEWTGRPIYENRDGNFSFLFMPDGGWKNVLRRVNDFRNEFHGSSVKIRTDDEPDVYYSGRLMFGEVSNVKGSAQFSIDADLDPFRYMDVNKTYTKTTTDVVSVDRLGKMTMTLTASGGDWNFKYRTYNSSTESYTWHGYSITDGTTTTFDCTRETRGKEMMIKPTGTAGSLTVSYTRKLL